MLRLLAVFGLLAVVVQQSAAQSISVGSGKIIYQILFNEWANPGDKLFTGKRCDILGRRCDTRFYGYVEVLGDDNSRAGGDYTWPGPNKNENKWPIIGQSSSKGATLRDFAYLNLTGVEKDKFREAILRVKVVDVDVLGDDEINSYIGRLPGLKDLVVQRYESNAEFSKPIMLEPLTTALPGVRKEKADRNAVQQMHLHVEVRAWGEDLQKNSRRVLSDAPSTRRNRRPPVREDSVSTIGSDSDETSISSRTRGRVIPVERDSTSDSDRSSISSRTKYRQIPIERDADTNTDPGVGGGRSSERNLSPKRSDDFFQRKLDRNNN